MPAAAPGKSDPVTMKSGLAEGGRQLRLQAFVPYRLAVVAREISKSLAQKYADALGITIPEWRVIAHLAEVTSCSSGEICARTAMDKAKVNRAVTRLVALGFVLAQTSSEDRRLNVLTLSRRGRAVYERIVPMALDHEALLTDVLSPAERRALLTMLDKLQRRVESLGEPRDDDVD
jgi:DNA-binding MarR family transcriptional regulator